MTCFVIFSLQTRYLPRASLTNRGGSRCCHGPLYQENKQDSAKTNNLHFASLFEGGGDKKCAPTEFKNVPVAWHPWHPLAGTAFSYSQSRSLSLQERGGSNMIHDLWTMGIVPVPPACTAVDRIKEHWHMLYSFFIKSRRRWFRRMPLSLTAAFPLTTWCLQSLLPEDHFSAVKVNAWQLPPASARYYTRCAYLTKCDAASRNSKSRRSVADADASSLERRTFATPADAYYQTNGRIPRPTVMHRNLPTTNKENLQLSSILIIGDVHGCYDELMHLYEKAIDANGGRDFLFVILVGDLCNKGPKSVEVIRHVRKNAPQWQSVRGNHDDGALAAALGDERRRQKPSYAWIKSQDEPILSDDDVIWMSELPYTIRIPAALLGETLDTVVVHAGLLPGKSLEEQTESTMVTLRELQSSNESDSETSASDQHTDSSECVKVPWATVWKERGQEFRVIFGHDAKRGLQRHNNDYAIGLDTGACYGKRLTGVILSKGKRTFVSVDSARVYSSIKKAPKN